MKLLKKPVERYLFFILLLGLLLRLASIHFANYYHSNEVFYFGGDTYAWIVSLDNLFSTGHYTVNPASEFGYFGRMPGYSIYLSVFYFLAGRNWDLALHLVYLSQILLDTVAVFLVFRTSMNIFKDETTSLVCSFLYATYPFIIIWNPIVYSECSSVFFMILGLWFISKPATRWTMIAAGAAFSMAALTRPQVICLFPLIPLFLYFRYKNEFRKVVLCSVVYSASVMVSYGWWPARNYLLHDKFVLTQDIRGFSVWSNDVSGFMEYLFSVTTEWEPTFSELAYGNGKVNFPPQAYRIKSDSLLLTETIALCRTCGSGFQAWRTMKGIEPHPFVPCDTIIENNFRILMRSQMQHEPYNYYIRLPLLNLKKALFKSALKDESTGWRKGARILFIYRSFLILLGLAGSIWILFRGPKAFGIMCLMFFVLVYGLFCFGPTHQMRNIEMRYLLHVGVLLLFPAGYCLRQTSGRLLQKRFQRTAD